VELHLAVITERIGSDNYFKKTSINYSVLIDHSKISIKCTCALLLNCIVITFAISSRETDKPFSFKKEHSPLPRKKERNIWVLKLGDCQK